MTCCRGKRREAPSLTSASFVEFEYRGRTSLTAVGSATRRLYWFERPSARVRVHPRDAASLDGVPSLVRVAPPR